MIKIRPQKKCQAAEQVCEHCNPNHRLNVDRMQCEPKPRPERELLTGWPSRARGRLAIGRIVEEAVEEEEAEDEELRRQRLDVDHVGEAELRERDHQRHQRRHRGDRRRLGKEHQENREQDSVEPKAGDERESAGEEGSERDEEIGAETPLQRAHRLTPSHSQGERGEREADARSPLARSEGRIALLHEQLLHVAEDHQLRLLSPPGQTRGHDVRRRHAAVRGLMMLTNSTAKAMGVSNRNDPIQSIQGGAKYYDRMLDLYTEVPLPDRNWYALVAYNMGPGAVQQIQKRLTAQGKNPNNWVNLYSYLDRNKAANGRYRQAVQYVTRIRAYVEHIKSTPDLVQL